MLIAISGTHCSGKSTLVNEFLQAHPDFVNEPEPYATLFEYYGEEFSAEPCADDFFRQLEFNVKRIRMRAREKDVIFERCPVDFLAYLLALKDLKREAVASSLIDSARDLTKDALAALDLIAFLPLDDTNVIEVPADEDPKLRRAMDRRLISILADDDAGILPASILVVELSGSTRERLRLLEDGMKVPQPHC